ncbi:aldo/keto reductase [Halobacteriovorax sp. ZH4_bin.1]|uniref:aldo/keto reductase n=1 Tax=unclassified Halobacteriovorax TaxID=2639665 RepID=UPI00371C7E26
MKFNQLGNTDIKVSEICLGTMTWGEQNTIEEAHEQLDLAIDYGVNFIDTAEMYPVPGQQHTYTKTEQFIGKWDKMQTHRDRFILASKVAGPGSMDSYIRNSDIRKSAFSKSDIKIACEASLKRLNTEYLDLYQIHWPSRVTNFFGRLNYEHITPEIEVSFNERVEAMDELIKEGKILHWGLSNESPWGVMKYLDAAKETNTARPVSIQNPYSLLNRSFEVGLAEMAIREKVGLLAYSPLAFGALSGKYLDGKRPANSRLTEYGDYFTRYSSEHAQNAIRAYVELANDVGLSPATLALAFVNKREFNTSNIIGATTMEQLRENLATSEVTLDSDTLNRIEEIHKVFTIPCP